MLRLRLYLSELEKTKARSHLKKENENLKKGKLKEEPKFFVAVKASIDELDIIGVGETNIMMTDDIISNTQSSQTSTTHQQS